MSRTASPPFFVRSADALEDAHVTGRVVSRLVDDPDQVPAGRVCELRQVVRREQQEVEPVTHAAFVMSPQGEESRWPASRDVPFHVAQVVGDPGPGDPRTPDDPDTRLRDLPSVAEESTHPRKVSSEP